MEADAAAGIIESHQKIPSFVGLILDKVVPRAANRAFDQAKTVEQSAGIMFERKANFANYRANFPGKKLPKSGYEVVLSDQASSSIDSRVH